jgi:hypothetical protein
MDELRRKFWNIKQTMKSIIAGLLMLGGAMAGARGEGFRTDINPGLRYWEAIMFAQNVPKDYRDELTTNEWRGRTMPAKIGVMLWAYDKSFRLMRAAAHSEVPCDWGLDITEGPELLLPHLAHAKALAQVARLRVMWDLQNGKQAEACNDLLATLALARRLPSDGTLISVLVEIAMENILISTVAENFYQFSPETLKQLDDGFAAAPARGTVAQAIATGERSFGDWFLRKVQEARQQHPGDEAAVMADICATFQHVFENGDSDGPANSANQILRAGGGTVEGLLKLIGELPPLYDRLAAVMSLPKKDYEAQIGLLNTEVQNSPNPLIAGLLPAVSKARPKEFSVIGKIAMLHAAVEYKLNGEAAFNQVMDPLADGPFTLERFSFNGVDRGFKLRSPYVGAINQDRVVIPQVVIFIEKAGPPFLVWGLRPGEAVPK